MTFFMLIFNRNSKEGKLNNRNFAFARGRTGFDSIWYGWCKHAVRWIISTLI